MSDALLHIFCLILLLSVLIYSFWIFVLSLGIRKGKEIVSKADSLPFVSVIVPYRNEEPHLIKLILQLIAQEYPHQKFEVIFVNDHSEDNSNLILYEFIQKNGVDNVHLIDLPEGVNGKKNALKKGIESSKGSWIVLTDADCSIKNKWLYELMKHTAAVKCKMILGPVKMHGDNLIQKVFCLEFASLQAVTEGACIIGKPFLSNGANLAFEKNNYEKLREVDGETFSSGDDVFLLHSFIKLFGNDCVRYAKSKLAIIETSAPKTLKNFLRQRIRWASKAKGYKNPWAGFTALLVLIVNSMFFLAGLLAFFNLQLAYCLIICLAVRFISEIIIFAKTLPFYHQTKLLLYYPFILPIYPIYIVLTTIGTLWGSYYWKDRRVS